MWIFWAQAETVTMTSDDISSYNGNDALEISYYDGECTVSYNGGWPGIQFDYDTDIKVASEKDCPEDLSIFKKHRKH